MFYNNTCYNCGVILTSENASPSYLFSYYRAGGLCRNCKTQWMRDKRCGGPLNKQHAGQQHTFACGCNGTLPSERGQSSDFAIWTCIGYGKYVWLCRKCEKQRSKRKTQAIKLEIMSHYCGGTPHCQCPGCRNGKENPVHIDALQIDHINGTDSVHRDEKKRRIAGRKLYHLLRREGYPSGVQVLCANCNGPAAKGNKKQCPLHGQPH